MEDGVSTNLSGGAHFDLSRSGTLAYVPGANNEGVRALLTSQYRTDTLLLWVAFFTSIFSVYALFNWLPTVLARVERRCAHG